jgi:hypothetical protein
MMPPHLWHEISSGKWSSSLMAVLHRGHLCFVLKKISGQRTSLSWMTSES